MTQAKQIIGTEATGAQIVKAETVNIGEFPANKATFSTPKHLTLLPAKNPHFVGREAELQQIKDSFSAGNMVYIVNGIGGIGKSELAYQYLHENRDNYHHIALFKFSKETTSLKDVLVNTLKTSLTLDDSITLEHILYRLQNLSGKALFIFDNLKNETDITCLSPLNADSDVLITTRLAVTSQGYLNLDILPLKDARILFKMHYSTDENIDDILEYIDCHSLFIELTAKTLNEACISLKELREKFQKGEFAKIQRNFEDSFNDFLTECFQIESHNLLKIQLQFLAILPSIEIDIATLEEIFIENDRLKLKLSALAKRGWLIKKENTYKLHQIIKEFILANYPLEFSEFSPIAQNIGIQLNPNDSYLNPIEKIHYIEIIDSILNCYPKVNDPIIASLLDALCNIHHSLARYNKSLDLQKRSLDMRHKLLGKKHPDTALSYNQQFPMALKVNYNQ